MTATAARQAALPARRSRRRRTRRAGRARNPRHRQDHPRDVGADRLCRRLLPLLRRPRRQDRGRAPADRQARHGGLAAARADRRRRRHRALEQPALPRRREDRPGAGGRLHAGGQGVGGRPGAAARIRPARRRGRFPTGRRQCHHRLRPDLRRRADAPSRKSPTSPSPAGRRRRGMWCATRPRTSPRTSLELGGKSPFIVFADADLESAANAQVAGIFAATGQSCVAGSRLIVERFGQGHVPGDPEAQGRGDADRLAARDGDRGGAALHGTPARA